MYSPSIGRTRPGAIVLHTSINIIGQIMINCDMIKLGNRYILCKMPSFTSISGYIQSTIVAIHHIVGIIWMNPPGMVIGMNPIGNAISRHQFGKGTTTILTHIDISENTVNSIFIFRIYPKITVIKGSITNFVFVIY